MYLLWSDDDIQVREISTRNHLVVVCRRDMECWGRHLNGEEGTKRVAYKSKEVAAKVKRRQHSKHHVDALWGSLMA